MVTYLLCATLLSKWPVAASNESFPPEESTQWGEEGGMGQPSSHTTENPQMELAGDILHCGAKK